MQRLTLLALAWCALTLGAHGQPNGAFQFAFTSAQLPLWDFTGTYSQSNATISLQLSLAHQVSGAISGTGSAAFSNGGAQIHATDQTAGRVTSVGKSVRLNTTGHGPFAGKLRGLPVGGTFSDGFALTLDSTTRTVSGREFATLCLAPKNCRSLSTNAVFSLPENMDGSWKLDLNIATTNGIVAGTATATLSNGRTISFNARGKYATKSATTKLRLSTPGLTPMDVVLDGSGELTSVRGRLLGQTVLKR